MKAKGLLINGRRVETKRTLVVKSPFDGSVVGEAFVAGAGEMEEAISSSQKAFDVLKDMPSYRRAEALGRVSRALGQRAEEISRTIALEAGKPIRDARAEVRRAAITFELAGEEAKRRGGELIGLDIAPGSEKRVGMVRRFPVGPVLGICPFNFPLNLAAHKAAPAMAVGNPIIIKPASKTPLTALMLGEIITEAGWPDGGVNIVVSSGRDVERVVTDPRIRKLTFTGSAPVGWALKSLAHDKKVTLELGGNAACIIHDDADLDLATRRCVAGAFSFAGQVCISVQRIFVQDAIFDAFVERFVALARALKMGDPLDEATDVGPMIDDDSVKKTRERVDEALSKGAMVLSGGGSEGRLHEPTVLTDTTPDMRVNREEAFAPLVTVERYAGFDEALDMADDSAFGLQAGVFTRDIKRIFDAYSRLHVGAVVINDIPSYRVDNMPYGGVKSSGCGREGVRYAMEEMTEPRLLVLNLP